MKDIDLLVEVARMYYDQDLTQQEIADKIYVSRSRVSRLIKKAKALGIVEIIIKPSFENHHNLEKILRDRFSLKDVLADEVLELVDRKTLESRRNLTAYAVWEHPICPAS